MSARFALASAAVLLSAAVAFPQKSADAAAKKPELVVGSPAPALTIEKWVKGAPVAGFEKGKTYVVEFWATWCGPCIASMPHLSEMQRQYREKGVTFIGVTSEDERNPLTAVEAMVKEKGNGMDYTVAWDSGRKTADAFMKASGQRGIPCSFVVDGEGRIAYIGHPMFLDMPIAQLVTGTWDNEKGNATVAEAKAKLNDVYKALGTDPKSAPEKIAEFETQYPYLVSAVAGVKFDALLMAGDFERAYAYASKRVDQAIERKDSSELNGIAWRIVDPAAKWEKLDLDLALRAAEKAVSFATEKELPATLDTLARVHFLKGDVKKAIEHQTKAVEMATGKMKENLEKALAEYKAKDTSQ